MIKRIVKLTFREEAIADFIAIFEASETAIRNFEGCEQLELWRHTDSSNVFFTYSIWAAPEHLEAYRQSDFFQKTWRSTKALFAEKAEAWSVEVINSTSRNKA